MVGGKTLARLLQAGVLVYLLSYKRVFVLYFFPGFSEE